MSNLSARWIPEHKLKIVDISRSLLTLSFWVRFRTFLVSPWYNYTYTYICRNIINNNDERTHFFRKIYHSLFIRKGCKRVVCERWVGDGTETVTYWPQVPLTIAALLPHSAGLLNQGPEGPSPLSGAGSHYGILSPTMTGTPCLELLLTDSN